MQRTSCPTHVANPHHRTIRLVAGLILALVAALALRSAMESAVPSARRLRPGSVVVSNGVAVVVPPAGETVWAEAVTPHGLHFALAVRSGRDGKVTVYRGEEVEELTYSGRANTGSSAAAALSACSDSAYSTYSSKWTSQYRWWFKSSTVPGEVQTDRAIEGLRNAMTNITHADNDCGLSDGMGGTSQYQGTTGTSSNTSSSGGCSSRDGKNVVDFGSLPSTMLALTCWWSSGGSTLESDMRLNKASFLWTVNIGSACSNKFSVEGVATHEFGHVFGLAHVDESTHGNLTMSPTIYPCQRGEATLGKGDVLALNAKY